MTMNQNLSVVLSKYPSHLPTAHSIIRTGETVLPEGYQPTEYDVVAGRGKGSYNRPGNRRFRVIIQKHIPEYLAAISKLDKSVVLGRIVDAVREQNNGEARFIKYDKNRGWYELGEEHTREKVGHAIREAIREIQSSETEQKSYIGEVLEKTKDQSTSFVEKQKDLTTQQQALFNKLMAHQIRARTAFYPYF